MSYVFNPTDWRYAIQCDKENVVPLYIRPTFLDYVTMSVATRFGRLAADPVDYTNLEGGLYYNTTSRRFKYRDNVSWKFFVTLDGAGINPVVDKGVARFSGTTGQIQGSLATLDDFGVITTNGMVSNGNVTLAQDGASFTKVGTNF